MSRGRTATPIRSPQIRNPRDPWASARDNPSSRNRETASIVPSVTCAVPPNDLAFHPRRLRPWGSASFCALKAMA
eukprot:419130-Alexandrium_andersonii.AAC.1